MSELPKCRLCGAEPVTVEGSVILDLYHPRGDCCLSSNGFMEQEWRTLMEPAPVLPKVTDRSHEVDFPDSTGQNATLPEGEKQAGLEDFIREFVGSQQELDQLSKDILYSCDPDLYVIDPPTEKPKAGLGEVIEKIYDGSHVPETYASKMTPSDAVAYMLRRYWPKDSTIQNQERMYSEGR